MTTRRATLALCCALLVSSGCERDAREPGASPPPRAQPGWRLEGVRFELLGATRLSVRAARGRLNPSRRALELERVSGRLGARTLRAGALVLRGAAGAVARDFTLSQGALRLAGRRLEIDLRQGSLDARDVRGDLCLGPEGAGALGEPSVVDPGPDQPARQGARAEAAR